jgi:hypothetical protein
MHPVKNIVRLHTANTLKTTIKISLILNENIV